jgi:mannitol-1-phosphate 5-dehydrogenase
MKAVIIGPGRIGCGLAGQLLQESGYDLTFLARNRELAAHLNRTGCYRVQLTGPTQWKEVTVGGLCAVWIEDEPAAVRALAEADVIGTAVGPQNLPAIAPLLAKGLARRNQPANVLAFENLINAGPCLRRLVRQRLRGPAAAVDHGFSGALVSRAVTQRLGSLDCDEPLLFIGDTPEKFMVHGPALRRPLPVIKGMVATDNYAMWVLRKLYVFSAGHATAAYLGQLKGYHYIHTAVHDPEIRAAVLAAMAEGQQGLAARFGKEIAGEENELPMIMARFENAGLNDPIQRVGRDPRRKLSANERLVGAAKLAQKAGVLPAKLALAAAAALCFCDPADPSCSELHSFVRNSGVEKALAEICGLDPGSPVGRSVAGCWEQLALGWQPGNLMLSLDRCMWSWSNGPQPVPVKVQNYGPPQA